MTLGLIVTGATFGAVSAGAALLLSSLLRTWPLWPGWVAATLFAGALVGGILAPIVSWVFLRRVPLGSAILRTTFAAALGATIGAVSTVNSDATILAGLGAFLAEVLHLWLRSRTGAQAPVGGVIPK